MKVSELARRSNVTPDTVRYYVRIDLLRPKRIGKNRYKQFVESDINRLQFIRKAKLLGYTLSEIRDILRDSERGKSPCRKVRRIIQRRIAENRHKLDEIAALQMRMEEALKDWATLPDGVPSGDTVCCLIESAAH